MLLFGRPYTTSCHCSIISCVVFEIFDGEEYSDRKLYVSGHSHVNLYGP